MLNFIKQMNLLILFIIGFILIGCSNTPNSVNITSVPGVCVQLKQYNQNIQQQVLTAFPYLANNPPISPYCMSFSIVNNNSGVNANNIQITNTGLQVTYYNSTNNLVTSSIYDPYSSGIATLSGFAQTAGSLTLFDPYNCATTTSSNVVTLNANGGKCTFYVQISAESYPIGIYPYTFSYNYTNGNANYTLSNTINQRIFMYGITQNNQLYSFIYNQAQYTTLSNFFTTPVVWAPAQNSSSIPQITNPNLVRDRNGFLYFISNNSVYLYNGMSSSQVGQSLTIINTLAIDPTGIVYAGTSSGVYYLSNISNVYTWILLSDTNNKLPGDASISQLSFSTTPSLAMYVKVSPIFGLYNCLLTITNSTPSINCNNIDLTNITPGPQYILSNINNTLLLIDPTAGNVVSYYINLAGAWNRISSNPLGLAFDQIATNAVTNNKLDTLFIGLGYPVTPNPNTSIIYTCSVMSPLPCKSLSSNGVVPGSGSSLFGSAVSILLDSQKNLYVAGINLNSGDWTTQTPVLPNIVTAILFSSSTILPVWIPITGSNVITGMVNSSILTSY